MNHLVIISGPGGVGKDALIAKLLQNHEFHLRKLVNTTSRKPRVGEQEGIDYHFLSRAAFEHKIAQNQMLEYEVMATNGEYYGTGTRELENELMQSHVICKKMPRGALTLKTHLGTRAITIFLDASTDELKRRLQENSRIGEQNLITKRLEQAKTERALKNQFDFTIFNHDNNLARAVNEAAKIIQSVLK